MISIAISYMNGAKSDIFLCSQFILKYIDKGFLFVVFYLKYLLVSDLYKIA